MSSRSIASPTAKLAKAVNLVAAQLRIAQTTSKKCKPLKLVRDETALKECNDSHDMSYDEKLLKMRKDCQNYFDDHLGKLDKKVKELSNLFDAAFALMKEFDKTRKNVEAIADGYCKIGTTLAAIQRT